MTRRGSRKGLAVRSEPQLDPPLLDAPMAVASDGTVLLNLTHIVADKNDLDAIIAVACATGLPVFVGVVVPVRHRARLAHDIDDALAGAAGRIGATLTSSVRGESASGPSLGAPALDHRDQRGRRAPRPRGRRP